MKRIVTCFALLLTLVLLFTGCGLGGNGTTGKATESETKTVTQTETQTTRETESETEKSVLCRLFLDGQCIGEQKVPAGTIVTEPEFTLEDNPQYRYSYIGWDTNGDGVPVTFPYTVDDDTDFNLLYSAENIRYHYDIYVDGVLVRSLDANYGDQISYPDVQSRIENDEVYFFLGWKYDGVFDGYTYFTVTKNCRIDACYAESQILKLYYNGMLYARYLEAGSVLNYAEICSAVLGEDEYLAVYDDLDCLIPHEGYLMPEGNLTVFARAELLHEPEPRGIVIDSDAELQTYFDDMVLNRITEQAFEMEYEVEDLNALMQTLSNNTINLSNFEAGAVLEDGLLTVTLSFGEIATKTSVSVEYTQLQSIPMPQYPRTRAVNYNGFAVELRTETMRVCNSDALFYALEHGYRPTIDATNTKLLTLYESMKKVLRVAVSDDMTDLQKAYAIYQYLVFETTYDADVLKLSELDPTLSLAAYRSFYLEGVFEDGLAVCDGFSKAYSALCAMEGIPCVRVTGPTKTGVNHAWNKVCLDGVWYVVDVTSGGCITGEHELFTSAYFLLTDAQYASYATADGKYYPEITCTTVKNVYDSLTWGTYSLKVQSINGAAMLLQAFITEAGNGTYSLEMQLDFDHSDLKSVVDDIMDAITVQTSIRYVVSRDTLLWIVSNNE